MNEISSQPYSSSNLSGENSHGRSISLQGTANFAWRILIIAASYVLISMIAGHLLGRGPALGALGISMLSGILIGVTLAPIAARMDTSHLRHWVVWGSVFFLNTLSVAIEGAFFAPTLSPLASMPVVWTAYMLFQSLVTAGLISWLFGQNTGSVNLAPLRRRSWFSWPWRFVVSSFSYLLFYFSFGAINYALITKPYYAAHVSGLVVPPPQTVLVAEMVRAPLIVLSIVPLILTWTGKRSMLALAGGMILFVIGGVVPLLINTALPDLLRLASVIEIFFQNFLTGVVTTALLGFADTKAPKTSELEIGELPCPL